MTSGIERVPPHRVRDVWPLVRGWVEKALAYSGSDETADEVRAHCESCTTQLWVATVDGKVSGVIVTQPQATTDGRVLQVTVLGGECLDAWLEHQRDLAAWGKARGCVGLRMRGRLGWQRRLRGAGWVPTAVEMELRE